jgi:ubiquinone/menaquinone biosynthesis C-methylase UbiE
VTAFSVFTHLLHSESYLCLEDIRRVLKPNGKCVFSFLEFSDQNHWPAFVHEVEARRATAAVASVLNTLIERNVVERWATHLGYTVECFVDASDAPWGRTPLGQTLALLGL